MLRFKLLTALFLLFFITSYSQIPTLKGILKDAETKAPLAGATVKIVSANDSSSVLSSKTGECLSPL